MKKTDTSIANVNNEYLKLSSLGISTNWIFLFFILFFLLFFALFVWLFKAKVVEQVEGTGITLLSYGVYPIVAKTDGRIIKSNISSNSTIKQDQILAQIQNDSIKKDFLLLKFDIEKLETTKENLNSQIKLLADIINSNKQDNRSSIVDVSSYDFENKCEYFLNNFSNKNSENFLNIYHRDFFVNCKSFVDQKVSRIEQSLIDKKNQISLLINYFDDFEYVRSICDGTIIEIFKGNGDLVKTNDTIALVASSIDEGIYLASYFPAEYAGKIKNGMKAYFSPEISHFYENGYIKGIVKETNGLPINFEAIEHEVVNKHLAKKLIGDNSSVIRVVIELIPNKNSPTGYEWTQVNNFKHQIVNGMLGFVYIDIDAKTPIDLLLEN